MAELTVGEARLIGVHRELTKWELHSAVGTEDASQIAFAFGLSFDSKEIDALTPKELKLLIRGYVGGIDMMRQTSAPRYEVPEETYFTGGPTGGVAEGQGTDPTYVAQTGVRPDSD